jgi:hypothetical protein
MPEGIECKHDVGSDDGPCRLEEMSCKSIGTGGLVQVQGIDHLEHFFFGETVLKTATGAAEEGLEGPSQ